MTWLVVTALVGLLVVLLLVAAWAYQTAHRLDRLHVRYDLSWQALDGALARRAVVARAVAVDSYGTGPAAKRLKALADAAEQAGRATRESAENELSSALALVDPASLPAPLVAELADAEARVTLARRFHNDAVRDTLALRERPAVRLLRLGGTAALPTYFEIAEQADRDLGATSRRTSARVVLLDERGAVLLFCGSNPADENGSPPRWWFTIGGAVQPGETLPEAAVRELAEETGLRVEPADMVGPVWRRDAVIDFNGSVMRSEEMFFVHRTGRFEPSATGRTALERRYIHGHRWCDETMIDELVAKGESVYPVQLGELLSEANALADAHGAAPQPPLQMIR
jgi:8-oxo-dGTP pyrophosphatase MutT (NUDIX family)